MGKSSRRKAVYDPEKAKRDAARMRERRAKETIEARNLRLSKNRERSAARLRSETPADRERRLLRLRAYGKNRKRPSVKGMSKLKMITEVINSGRAPEFILGMDLSSPSALPSAPVAQPPRKRKSQPRKFLRRGQSSQIERIACHMHDRNSRADDSSEGASQESSSRAPISPPSDLNSMPEDLRLPNTSRPAPSEPDSEDDDEALGNIYEPFVAISEGDADEVAAERPTVDASMYCHVELGQGADPTPEQLVQPGAGNFQYLGNFKLSNCYYCRKLQANLTRHLQSQHRFEAEVAAIFSEPSKQNRINLWNLLRHKGNHVHNVEVLGRGEGTLIVCMPQNETATADTYAHCPDCLGYYAESRMRRRHSCLAEKLAKQPERPKAPPKALPQHASSGLDVVHIMQTDPTLQKYGANGANDSPHLKSKSIFSRLRSRLGRMARLLLLVRGATGSANLTLAQAIDPNNVPAIVQAAKKLNFQKKDFLSLYECAQLCKAECLQREAAEEAERYDAFVQCCTNEWASLKIQQVQQWHYKLNH